MCFVNEGVCVMGTLLVICLGLEVFWKTLFRLCSVGDTCVRNFFMVYLFVVGWGCCLCGVLLCCFAYLCF